MCNICEHKTNVREHHVLVMQDAINALTNQNSELKAQVLRDVSNNYVRDVGDTSSQVSDAPVGEIVARICNCSFP